MHPQIAEIVEGIIAREKYVYLCTNGLLLKEKIDQFKPSKYFSFVVHMDGQREHHDFSVCREGTYDKAVEGIREALAARFPRDDQYDAVRRRRSARVCGSSSTR